MKALSYTLSFIIPLSVYVNLQEGMGGTFLALIVAFAIIPVLDFLVPSPKDQHTKDQHSEVKRPFYFDLQLYCVGLFHLYLVYLFTVTFSANELWWEQLGKILALGLSCGVIAINVGHELGHRKEKLHIFSALLLLATSLYTQFYVEHNKGHHKNVATPQDASSARLNENLYHFIIRSMLGTFKGAYQLDRKMFWVGMSLQSGVLLSIYLLSDFHTLLAYVGAAFFGGLNLEAVNYIEHYGLLRKKRPSGRIEKVRPHHSWNSNHFLGRKILFELTRHSDHHAYVSRPYYHLRNHDDAPTLPAGYPAMMLLALFPSLFFKVMNPKVKPYLET